MKRWNKNENRTQSLNALPKIIRRGCSWAEEHPIPYFSPSLVCRPAWQDTYGRADSLLLFWSKSEFPKTLGHAHGCWRQAQSREEVKEKGMRLKETVRVERRESEPCRQETEVKRMKEVEKREKGRWKNAWERAGDGDLVFAIAWEIAQWHCVRVSSSLQYVQWSEAGTPPVFAEKCH